MTLVRGPGDIVFYRDRKGQARVKPAQVSSQKTSAESESAIKQNSA